jgi:hypothetical protein
MEQGTAYVALDDGKRKGVVAILRRGRLSSGSCRCVAGLCPNPRGVGLRPSLWKMNGNHCPIRAPDRQARSIQRSRGVELGEKYSLVERVWPTRHDHSLDQAL